MPTRNPLLVVRGVQVSTDVLRALFVVNVDRTLGEGVHWNAQDMHELTDREDLVIKKTLELVGCCLTQ